MSNLLDLIFPIQFDTLRWRWVFLSLLIIGWWILYNFVQYFFPSLPTNVLQEEVSTDELVMKINEESTIDKKINDISLWNNSSQWSWLSSFLLMLKPKTKPRIEDVFNGEWFDEEIERSVQKDGFEVEQEDWEIIKVESKKHDIIDDTIMTEQKAKEIDNLTRSTIQREDFESDLNYLKKKQKREEYEKKLIEWLAKDSEHEMILEQLALYYVEHNQEKKSLPLFKKLLDHNPENHKVLRHMADIYLTLEDVETSEVLVKRALSLSPNNPKYAITLVEIYYNTKRKDEAISLMEDVVKRRPANLWYRDTLAKLYEEMKDYDLAVECYQSMLIIDPKNPTLKRKLLETRTKLE
jgi:tetratricopeptide (TPR) repeat protein